MKKAMITMALLMAIAFAGQAQEKLKVGDLKNGKLVITEWKALQGYLNKSLDNSGTLGNDYKVIYAPEANRLFLHFPVTGNENKVTGIGIMLVVSGNEAFIAETPAESSSGPGGGGSFEVQCLGSCPTCLPNIKWIAGHWLPMVFCECTQGEQGECTMISKIVIHINVGF